MHLRIPGGYNISFNYAGPLHHKSILSASDHPPIIDEFTVAFWFGTFGLIAATLVILWRYEPDQFKNYHRKDSAAALDEDEAQHSSRVSQEDEVLPNSHVQALGGDMLWTPYEPSPKELGKNLWSLNLIASIGQAKVQKKVGLLFVECKLTPWLVAVVSMSMAACQFVALFCMVHDLNPYARPVTTRPRQAWVESTWTVNCMKWFMMTYLSFNAIEEAGESVNLMKACYEIDARRLSVPRWITMMMGIMQYLVLCSTLLAGESAVLSFSAVPDVIYSSVAITFINTVDDVVYSVLHTIMGVEANFVVDPLADVIDGETQSHCKSKLHEIPGWLDGFFQYLVFMPLPWGLYIGLHAFITNVMPNMRLMWLAQDILKLAKWLGSLGK